MQMGEFKQEVMKLNNRVNMEVFNQGLHRQKVDIIQDKILITAHNNRVKVLSVVDKYDMDTTRRMDLALIKEFKERFILYMLEDLGVTVLTHMKDYDPKLELSLSVTILTQPVEELLPHLKTKSK
ncbi:Na-translocating system protein MpsC family protein [Christensenellaceae bacterium OttesenSCG-928-L17]|nr:Na-translocating system protein MpsC family protein [Christensenellaceae bacterium OttesenSCG-928-L17]